ncbi:MAG TPA: division/cell wall cluster transcriptional repressor MraZ [Anaerolineaceae bacterium]
MFLGQYDHNIDEKGRLTVPARYRELLEKGAYITQGLDQNLWVMPAAMFDQMYKKVSEKSFTDPKARLLRRLVFSNADRVEVDKAGRMLIPQFLRQPNGLDGEAVIVGTGEYFEIWSRTEWQNQQKELQNTEANQERFAGLDLSFETE